MCIRHWRASISLSFDITSTKIHKKLNLKEKKKNMTDGFTRYRISSDDEGEVDAMMAARGR